MAANDPEKDPPPQAGQPRTVQASWAPPPEEPAKENPDPLTEGLFAPATVRLFVREFKGLTLGPELGLNPFSNNPLIMALRNLNQPTAVLARIYGFSYQGNYYKMSAPAVFAMSYPGDT